MIFRSKPSPVTVNIGDYDSVLTLSAVRGLGPILGQLRCYKDGDRLTLGDLEVAEQHRRQGIATQLLKTAVDHALRQGFRELEGRISKQDLKVSGFLLDWYARLGFAIEDLADPHFAKAIRRTLTVAAMEG